MTVIAPPPLDDVATAYTKSGAAWPYGPGRIYDRLAEVVVAHSPVPVVRRRVLDAGAGTGAASRAVLAAGAAEVVAVDVAIGMLAQGAGRRPPAVVADVGALPFEDCTFGAAIAAFCLNHLADPVRGIAELVRVLRPRGGLVAAVYAAEDDHPAKAVVEELLAQRGWTAPPWYPVVEGAARRLSTPDRCVDAAALAGLEAEVERIDVGFPELTLDDVVAWRLGMAHHAPFVATLALEERAAIASVARRRLGSGPPLVRSIIVLSARRQ